jgi:P-type Cu+ transporter
MEFRIEGNRSFIMPMSIDPVCGKSVDESTGLSAKYRGREYYFDSEECLHRFESDPARYIEHAA